MTPKQKKDYNKMRMALLRISRHYQTPNQLHRNSQKQYDLDYEETLEMAYENIQAEAKLAVKGTRPIE